MIDQSLLFCISWSRDSPEGSASHVTVRLIRLILKKKPHDNWKIMLKYVKIMRKTLGHLWTSAFLAFWHFYQGHIANIRWLSVTFTGSFSKRKTPSSKSAKLRLPRLSKSSMDCMTTPLTWRMINILGGNPFVNHMIIWLLHIHLGLRDQCSHFMSFLVSTLVNMKCRATGKTWMYLGYGFPPWMGIPT